MLCDFHREQAWERWLNTTSNGMRTQKGVLLAFLRRLASSKTEEAYKQNLKDLYESDIWNLDQTKKLRDWISNT